MTSKTKQTRNRPRPFSARQTTGACSTGPRGLAKPKHTCMRGFWLQVFGAVWLTPRCSSSGPFRAPLPLRLGLSCLRSLRSPVVLVFLSPWCFSLLVFSVASLRFWALAKLSCRPETNNTRSKRSNTTGPGVQRGARVKPQRANRCGSSARRHLPAATHTPRSGGEGTCEAPVGPTTGVAVHAPPARHGPAELLNSPMLCSLAPGVERNCPAAAVSRVSQSF